MFSFTDKNQAVPVEVQRNGLRAILSGAGANALELRFLAANAEIVVGDILMTSGLDGIYPRGLPVARVTTIERDAAFTFARIRCMPLAGVEQHGQVLILGSQQPAGATPDMLNTQHQTGTKAIQEGKK